MNDMWHDLRRLVCDRGGPLVELDPENCLQAVLFYPDGRRERIVWHLFHRERWEVLPEEP